MADLTDIQAAMAVKVVGSDSTGTEQTPVKSTTDGELRTTDIVDAGGVQGAISVSTTPVACRVSGSNLAARKRLTVTNSTTAIVNSTLYWGYDNTVSSSSGTPLEKSSFISDNWGPNTTIWIVAASGTHNVRITEGA